MTEILIIKVLTDEMPRSGFVQHGLYTALAKPRLASGKFSSSLRRVLFTFPVIQADA